MSLRSIALSGLVARASSCALLRTPGGRSIACHLGAAQGIDIDTCNVTYDNRSNFWVRMIESFRHKGLKRLFEKGERRGINPQFVERVENILGLLDAATTIQDMALPSFRLHALT